MARAFAAQPRELLRQVRNLRLVEIPGWRNLLCSAGSYNIDQPETAAELGAA